MRFSQDEGELQKTGDWYWIPHPTQHWEAARKLHEAEVDSVTNEAKNMKLKLWTFETGEGEQLDVKLTQVCHSTDIYIYIYLTFLYP